MSNLNLLIKINNTEVLNQFLHYCIDDLIKIRPISYNTFSNDIEWTNEDYQIALKSVQNLFTKAIYDEDDALLEETKHLDSYVQDAIIKCYRARKNQITSSVIIQKISTAGPLMTEFDWRLRLVMGSAKLSNFMEPLLQLDIKTLDNSDNKPVTGNISLEMNENELTNFINVLESASVS